MKRLLWASFGPAFSFSFSSDFGLRRSLRLFDRAIELVGRSCPPGQYRSGDYCMAGSERAKPAITRQGSSCPRGYYRSGEYCMQSK